MSDLPDSNAAFRTPCATIRTDPNRLAALHRTMLLDMPAEAAFDRLTRLATTILNAPVALVSLVDEDRQLFKNCIGLPEPWTSQRETPLLHSFCQHTIASHEPLLIEDTRIHPLVERNLAIPDLGVVAYAGIPQITADGYALGSFCAIDTITENGTIQRLASVHADPAKVAAAYAMRQRYPSRWAVRRCTGHSQRHD